MIFEILDYKGDRKPVDIGDLNDIATINIVVISGDETLEVIFKDYSKGFADSGVGRWCDFPDSEYEIYNFQKEKNLIDDPDFLNRKSSYSYPEWDWEDEE